jgi:outer membrane protein assembly factor BamB
VTNRLRTGVIAACCVLIAAGCDWTQWGGGPGHSGSAFEPSFTNTTVPALVALPMASLPITGQASVRNGIVFATTNGSLVAFDAKSHGVVWTASLPAGSTAGSVPAVDSDSNTVFVVVSQAPNPVLLGFDVDGIRNCDTLHTACSPVLSAQLGSTNGPATPPVVDGGKVFANGAANLYAFDAAGNTNCVTLVGTRVCTPLWSAATGFAASGIGPTVANGIVHDAASNGLRAFDAATGALRWTDTVGAAITATPSLSDTSIYVPAGGSIVVFARDGCGSATCAAAFTLERRPPDASGSFLGTPAIDGANVFATNGNGELYAWAADGCRHASCRPSSFASLNAPTGGSTNYAQSVAIGNGFGFVLARRIVSGTDHVVLSARSVSDLHEVKS